MADKREQIMIRLFQIAEGIDGVDRVVRNMDVTDDTDGTVVSLYDADENANDQDPNGRPNGAPRRIGMTPQIVIELARASKDIGTAVNAMRAKFLKAVLLDAELKSILGPNGEARYEGVETPLGRGLQMEAKLSIMFTFLYVLRASDL